VIGLFNWLNVFDATFKNISVISWVGHTTELAIAINFKMYVIGDSDSNYVDQITQLTIFIKFRMLVIEHRHRMSFIFGA
jgi:hypothetical protein